MKNLSKLLYKLTKAEEDGFDEIPEDWEFIENCKGEIIHSCGKLVEVEYFPYAFDKDNNEVHYIGICPKCGDFIYVRD